MKVYGELRIDNSRGVSMLQADLTADGIADFEIQFDRVIIPSAGRALRPMVYETADGISPFTPGDFIL